MIGEDDGVEIDLPQIGRWRQWQAGVAILPGAPSMIDPPRIARKITTAVHRHQLQFRESRERSREDQIVKRERRIERVTQYVAEVVVGQALPVGKSIRMHHNERAKLFALGKERTELRIG